MRNQEDQIDSELKMIRLSGMSNPIGQGDWIETARIEYVWAQPPGKSEGLLYDYNVGLLDPIEMVIGTSWELHAQVYALLYDARSFSMAVTIHAGGVPEQYRIQCENESVRFPRSEWRWDAVAFNMGPMPDLSGDIVGAVLIRMRHWIYEGIAPVRPPQGEW